MRTKIDLDDLQKVCRIKSLSSGIVSHAPPVGARARVHDLDDLTLDQRELRGGRFAVVEQDDRMVDEISVDKVSLLGRRNWMSRCDGVDVSVAVADVNVDGVSSLGTRSSVRRRSESEDAAVATDGLFPAAAGQVALKSVTNR